LAALQEALAANTTVEASAVLEAIVKEPGDPQTAAVRRAIPLVFGA
jgi:hypothetical protein